MYVYGQLTARRCRQVVRVSSEGRARTTEATEDRHGSDTDDAHSADALLEAEEFVTIGNRKWIAQFPEQVQVEAPGDQGEE